LRTFLPALFAALAICLPIHTFAEDFSITSAHGAAVNVIAEFPDGAGPHPAIVLAPGQGYHMRLPALEETARALVRSGVAVFRFDWAYFTAEPRGRPSKGLENELQDIQAVIGGARQHAKVDQRRVAVGGKSLGSGVAWRAFAADSSLRSALLLTPICSRIAAGQSAARSEAEENYPGFSRQARPVLLVSGDQDPLCATQVLLQFAATGSTRTRVAIVGGDHGFESRAPDPSVAEAERRRHIAAVAAVAASFVPGTVGDPEKSR
jgi:predicted alpha/beta-hydrolase family hydrolase